MLPGESSARRPEPSAPAAQRVLVAGAAGFIGTNLVRDLVRRGLTVHGLVRATSGLAALEGLANEVTLHRADATEREALRDCLRRARPDAVINLLRASRDADDPLANLHDQVVAAVNLITVAADVGCARFVQFGSSMEHAARAGPIDESTPLEPVTLHGAMKASATIICRQLAREHGIRLTVLRPFHVYGPWDHSRHLIPTAIARALDGQELVLAPGGRRDWTYVDDVVEACALAMNAEVDGQEINLGSGRQWSNEEVVATIAEITGRTVPVRLDEGACRPWDRRDWVADIAKARALLGWEPRHDLRSGLEATVAWERRRRGRSSRGSRAPSVSVVVPVYRNADTLRELHARLTRGLGSSVPVREVIFVNDGCDAGSARVLRELATADEAVRIVEHATNLGQHAAVLSGLERARGKWTVVLDGDLQDPPETIPSLLASASPAVDAVFAGRRGTYEPWTRLLTGRVYRMFLRIVAGTPADAGMYVALSRRMVDRLLEMRSAMADRAPQVVAMIGCSGLATVSVPVDRNRRPAGRTAYSAARRLRSAAQALAWAAAWRRRSGSPAPAVSLAHAAASDRGAGRIQRHNASQRRYFEGAVKSTMVPRDSAYLNHHVDEVLAAAGVGSGDRVLEVGCGMGRYTLLFAERGIRVEGLDLSPVLLGRLRELDGGRYGLRLHCADVLNPPAELVGSFDAVVGLFALHHMHDVPRSLRAAARLLRPGGRLTFCEPNPYNPLYYVQIAARPGMNWEGDGGIVKIRRRPVSHALAAAGLRDVFWRRFGFCPPFLVDSRFGSVERRLEAFPLWRGILPFQVFGGRLAADAGAFGSSTGSTP